MNILAIDVGTSSVKSAILNVHTGQPRFGIYKSPVTVDQRPGEGAEIQPKHLWQAIVKAVHKAMQDVDNNADMPLGVGLSVLTPGLVLVDHSGEPLGPIWIHLDRRSRPIAKRLLDEVGDAFLNTVGNRPLPGGITITSYLAQVEADPGLPGRIGQYLHVNGWLVLKMTGAAGFDPGNASFTGLYDTLNTRHWSRQWCEYFDVKPEWLPPVVCGSTTMGQLRQQVAAELGLPAGIPVKLGVPDTSSAMLAHNMTADDLLHVVGTTQVLAVLVDDPKPNANLLTRQTGFRQQYMQVAHNPVGGVALEWIWELCFRHRCANKEELKKAKEQFFRYVIPKAARMKTSVILKPPFLGGDRLQIEESRAAFQDVTLATGRMDLLAAVLQALVEQHRVALANLAGERQFRRILLTGGGAKTVQQLIPEYKTASVERFKEGSLLGVAHLFRNEV